jgi:predicted nucleic acid-binding protein
MLTTSNEHSKMFLEKKRLLLDSCILIDFSKDAETKEIICNARELYTLVLCTVSLLEVGFGPIDKIDVEEQAMARKIVSDPNTIFLDHPRTFDGTKFEEDKLLSFCPTHLEWYAARHFLVEAMGAKRVGGSKGRKLGNDALIYACAWNTGSSLLTNNIRDFAVFNEVNGRSAPSHQLPLYTLDDLKRSFSEEVSFPGNLDLR